MSIDSDVNLSVHCYYSKELDAGLRACERLLNNTNDNSVKNMAMRNRVYYMQPLSELISMRYHRISSSLLGEGWNQTNPSIIQQGNGYLVNIRHVNYKIVEGRYVINDVNNKIRTENVIIKYDEHFNALTQNHIQSPEYPRSDFAVDGIEDVRLFSKNDQVMLSATIRNHESYSGWASMTRSSLINNQAVGLEVMYSDQCQVYEKNWMPVIGQPDTWVYLCGPITKIASLQNGKLSIRDTGSAKPITANFRGSSQVVPFKDGFLACIHEVAHLNERIYSHRFVQFRNDLSVDRVSKPFYIKTSTVIEFVAGMSLSVDGKGIILSFGHQDSEAWLAHMNITDLEAIF